MDLSLAKAPRRKDGMKDEGYEEGTMRDERLGRNLLVAVIPHPLSLILFAP
jgi:hypothetical protein